MRRGRDPKVRHRNRKGVGNPWEGGGTLYGVQGPRDGGKDPVMGYRRGGGAQTPPWWGQEIHGKVVAPHRGAQGPQRGVRNSMGGCRDSTGRTQTPWKGVRYPTEGCQGPHGWFRGPHGKMLDAGGVF